MWAYSISIVVGNPIKEHWLVWMKEFFIHEIMETNFFNEFMFSKIHHDEISEDSTNYNLTLKTYNRKSIFEFQEQYELTLREQARILFKDQILFFTTELEYLS